MVSSVTVSPLFTGRLPVPPGINQSYRFVSSRTGGLRMAHTSAAQQFTFDAQRALAQGRQDAHEVQALREAPSNTPLKGVMRWYLKELWRRDVDGIIKTALDEVFRHLELNNSLVVRSEATKQLDKKNPRIEVEVRLLHITAE